MAHMLMCVCTCVCPLAISTSEWQAGSCLSFGFGVTLCPAVWGHPHHWWPRHSPLLSRLTDVGHEAHNPRAVATNPPNCFLYRLCIHLPPMTAQEQTARWQILTWFFREAQIPSTLRIRFCFSRCVWGSKEGCRVKSSLGYVDQGKPGKLQPVKVTTVAEPSDSGSKRLAMLWNVCPSPLFSSSSFSERQGHASKQQEEVGQCTNCTSSCGRVTIWLHL